LGRIGFPASFSLHNILLPLLPLFNQSCTSIGPKGLERECTKRWRKQKEKEKEGEPNRRSIWIGWKKTQRNGQLSNKIGALHICPLAFLRCPNGPVSLQSF
jgi:hypothetical protein